MWELAVLRPLARQLDIWRCDIFTYFLPLGLCGVDAKGLHATDSKLRAITQALPPQCPGIEIILGSSRLQWEVHAQPGHYLSPTQQVATAQTAMGSVCLGIQLCKGGVDIFQGFDPLQPNFVHCVPSLP